MQASFILKVEKIHFDLRVVFRQENMDNIWPDPKASFSRALNNFGKEFEWQYMTMGQTQVPGITNEAF